MNEHPYKSEIDRDSEKHLAQLQEKVKHFWPKLDVDPPLAKPFEMDEKQFEIYLSQFKKEKHANVLRRFITTHLRNISMDELKLNLRKCVINLNTKEPKNFKLLVQKNHSQHWVAELALRHLNALPIGSVDMHREDFKLDSQAMRGVSTLVMFDDCSYTGTQLCIFILPKIFEAVSKRDDDESLLVYFVIPFITKPALDKVEKQYETLKKKYGDRVELKIIHEELLPTIGDLDVPEEDKPLLVKALGAANYQKMEKYVMITTDWKGAPDYVSFIPSIANADVEYTVGKYTGWEFANLPEDVKNARPFLPKVKTPYCAESRQEKGEMTVDLEGVFLL